MTSQLHGAFTSIMRKRYYHGQVPESEMQAVMKEAQDEVINAILIAQELERQQIPPDSGAVNAELADYEARYRDSSQWQRDRESILPGLRQEMERRSRLAQLEVKVKNASVGEEDVKKFYQSRPELFTEPEKIRLQAILLHVDPSSPPAVWEMAKQEAESISRRLKQGANFDEAARMHSQDKSSANGGDMGYLHKGMIPTEIQNVVDAMKVGDLSDPIIVLEGVAIVRLTERMSEKLRSYEDVADRARGLLQRERQDQAWKDFVAALRAKASIRFAEPQAPLQR